MKQEDARIAAALIMGLVILLGGGFAIWACKVAPEAVNIVLFVIVTAWVLGGCRR